MVSDKRTRGHGRTLSWEKPVCISTTFRGSLLESRRVGSIEIQAVLSGTVQYNTLQYSTVQYSTVQYTTVQYSTIPGIVQ